ncbi:MAG: response regulator transcription factor [Pedobacter sp.]|nr:MAG: response regulator transcription factor [Pedobacter sp.]
MINIILADDHKLVQNGIKLLLQEDPSLHVVAEASSGTEVLQLLETHTETDVVLTDIMMPGMDGLTLQNEMAVKFPSVKVIFLSMYNEIKQISTAMKNGASGYLLKDADHQELLFCINFAVNGGVYVSSRITTNLLSVLDAYTHPQEINIIAEQLTEREMQVLQLIAEGLTNMEIADKLFLSKRTIEGHRQELLKKTGAKNTVMLIRAAVVQRLV